MLNIMEYLSKEFLAVFRLEQIKTKLSISGGGHFRFVKPSGEIGATERTLTHLYHLLGNICCFILLATFSFRLIE